MALFVFMAVSFMVSLAKSAESNEKPYEQTMNETGSSAIEHEIRSRNLQYKMSRRENLRGEKEDKYLPVEANRHKLESLCSALFVSFFCFVD